MNSVTLVKKWEILADECKKELEKAKDENNPIIMSEIEIARYEQAERCYRFCANQLKESLKAVAKEKALIYCGRTCPECKKRVVEDSDHEKGCMTVWGRRGWRRLGEYDG